MGEKLIHIYELEKLTTPTIVFHILGEEHRVYSAVQMQLKLTITRVRGIADDMVTLSN